MTNAKYQTRCDKCGRFMSPDFPGSSWVNVPHSDISYGDERNRCAFCTRTYGAAECSPEYVKCICCGVVPEKAEVGETIQ
jgi:hypothetical protein